MEISLKLDKTEVKCKIGFGVVIAATDYLREREKREYLANKELYAGLEDLEEAKQAILNLLPKHLNNQVASEAEAKQWLQTMEGNRFAMVYGTQRYGIKLTEETAMKVMDDMTEAEWKELRTALMAACFGSEASQIQDQAGQEALEIARIQLQGVVNQKEALRYGMQAAKDEMQLSVKPKKKREKSQSSLFEDRQ